MKKITIAIDGHSSCGKSTMAKDLAREVGYVYVDTGAMYRSVTLYALRKGLFNDDGSVRTDALEAEMPHIRISFKFNPETGRLTPISTASAWSRRYAHSRCRATSALSLPSPSCAQRW